MALQKKIIEVQDGRRGAVITLLVGVPDFGIFGGFGEISGENGAPYWPPQECKQVEKTVHHPSWVISEVLLRVNLGHRHAWSAKSTLGRISEMAHEGQFIVFSTCLHS